MHSPKSSAHIPSLQHGAELHRSPRFLYAVQILPQLPQFLASVWVSAEHAPADPPTALAPAETLLPPTPLLPPAALRPMALPAVTLPPAPAVALPTEPPGAVPPVAVPALPPFVPPVPFVLRTHTSEKHARPASHAPLLQGQRSVPGSHFVGLSGPPLSSLVQPTAHTTAAP